jgi:hypothetical protein
MPEEERTLPLRYTETQIRKRRYGRQPCNSLPQSHSFRDEGQLLPNYRDIHNSQAPRRNNTKLCASAVSAEVSTRLFQTYFNCIHPVWPILEKTSLHFPRLNLSFANDAPCISLCNVCNCVLCGHATTLQFKAPNQEQPPRAANILRGLVIGSHTKVLQIRQQTHWPYVSKQPIIFVLFWRNTSTTYLVALRHCLLRLHCYKHFAVSCEAA